MSDRKIKGVRRDYNEVINSLASIRIGLNVVYFALKEIVDEYDSGANKQVIKENVLIYHDAAASMIHIAKKILQANNWMLI